MARFKEVRYIIKKEPKPIVKSPCGKKSHYDYDRVYATIELEKQHDNKDIFSGPLDVDIIFEMQIPPKKAAADPHPSLYAQGAVHITHPLLSNLIRFIEDVAKDILFHNASQIANIHAKKIYSNDPKTIITIRPCRKLL